VTLGNARLTSVLTIGLQDHPSASRVGTRKTGWIASPELAVRLRRPVPLAVAKFELALPRLAKFSSFREPARVLLKTCSGSIFIDFEHAATCGDLSFRLLPLVCYAQNRGLSLPPDGQFKDKLGPSQKAQFSTRELNQPVNESDLIRERVGSNIGETGNEEVSRLAVTQHIAVAISADTPISSSRGPNPVRFPCNQARGAFRHGTPQMLSNRVNHCSSGKS
jgi:hypothetical protein